MSAQPNPMAGLFWIFRDRDGCATGSMHGAMAGSPDQAFAEHYDTARERKAAKAKGVTVELVNRENWPEACMTGKCGHRA
jgi:hypothetical protein